jgi:hypothetical protein
MGNLLSRGFELLRVRLGIGRAVVPVFDVDPVRALIGQVSGTRADQDGDQQGEGGRRGED